MKTKKKNNAHAGDLTETFLPFLHLSTRSGAWKHHRATRGFPFSVKWAAGWGRLAFVTANNPVSPREKKEEEEKKRKRENGKQRHAQGVEKWARAQRRPSERDYEMNLLTAAAAAAVVEAREHNDSGRQRRTLFTSPLRVPSSLHRMARIGVRAHCYT